MKKKMWPSIGYMKRADNDTLSEDDVRFIVHVYTTGSIKVKPSNSQAMALVKKLHLSVAYLQDYVTGKFFWYCNHGQKTETRHTDINCAICDYVAKMLARK